MLFDYWQKSASSMPAEPGAERRTRMALLNEAQALTFTGEDVLSFLQGYFTCDLSRLREDSYTPTALTNLKGRVVANGWSHLGAEHQVNWILHRSLTARVAEFMKPYLAFSRTTLQPRDDDHLIIGSWSDASTSAPAPLIVDSAAAIDSLFQQHTAVSEQQWKQRCISTHVVMVNEVTAEQFLPQMLGLVQLGAVDFDKGCYLGQEVVARAQHRGQVKRSLKILEYQSANGPEAGSTVTDSAGADAGTIVAAAGNRCLAVLGVKAVGPYLCRNLPMSEVSDR
ncbi:MAG: folate-binding protein YgfZ [Pseudomonadales bacterium]